MNEESLAFSKLPIEHQNRIEDRIAFLYLERMKIVQDEHGVVGFSKDEYGLLTSKIQIPVGGIALLMLGPGISISPAAVTSASRSGCTILFTGGGGFPEYTTIQPLTSSSKWILAQATVVTNPTLAKKVAKEFYAKQFGQPLDGSISQMRGIEGALMKKTYAFNARQHKIKHFRRDTSGEDNINIALNILNSILYGLASAACQAIGISPALGIIHRGNPHSFLHDIADFYKPSITIPIAFSLSTANPEDVPKLARMALRNQIEKNNLLTDIIKTITKSFTPYLPENAETDTLIGGVSGHTNYSTNEAKQTIEKVISSS